jgi:hypothetical protein
VDRDIGQRSHRPQESRLTLTQGVMQASAEAVSTPDSPHLCDLEMSRPTDLDPDFEFFDANPLEEASSDLDVFFTESLATEDSQVGHFDSPAISGFKSPTQSKAPIINTKVLHPISAPSTVSPAGSLQDSSSDSSGYKRKSSSESSRSALTAGDILMMDEDMLDWKMDDLMGDMETNNPLVVLGASDGTIDPISMDNNYQFNDKTMENDFDFESAASSPSPFAFGRVSMDSPEMPTIRHDTPHKHSPVTNSKFNKNHIKANSQHSVTHTMKGLTTSTSREASPLSAMVTSQDSSPAALFSSSPSPGTGAEYVSGTMFNDRQHNPPWPTSFGVLNNHGLPLVQQQSNEQSQPQVPQVQQQQQALRMTPAQGVLPMGPPFKPVLSIHPTPMKSRVETQIPIKMTLYPMPKGITKLHLPTHTISKPKLLAKPTPERAPDTLELYTTLVCTSAMQDPENRRRAFERAASQPVKVETKSDDEELEEKEEDKALNGGDVTICPGCITRERKRAARKKVKKVEEEESWIKDEAKRVIVFNTQETKEWQAPSSQPATEAIAVSEREEPYIPDGAMQVDAPMRIACYCRHQNEKLGFQVIFTIKDYQDHLVAQAMTNPIMITDDHKTHNMPSLSTQSSTGSDGQRFNGPAPFPVDQNYDAMAGLAGNLGPFRTSHSTSDLQNLRGGFNPRFPHNINMNTPTPQSQTTSATMTPRNMSRQTSPSTTCGPMSKKRKASGSGKVPTGLAMTRLETGQLGGPGQVPPISMPASNATSPFTPSMHSFTMSDMPFGQSPTAMPGVQQQYNTGPPTPNSNDQIFLDNHNRSLSMENLGMAHSMYSAPPSAHPSRAPSPNGPRNAVGSYHQQHQMGQGITNGLYNMPLAFNSSRPPTIHKLIPNEGPKSGGVEVTCLGSGFFQGLEVMFGDIKATTTTFWGENSLVCLLPPSAFAGTVPVSFRQQQQPMQPYPQNMPKSQALFKYYDDDEQQLIRTALAVLGHKMTGKMEDVRDLARRIVGDGSSSWGGTATQPASGGQGNQQISGFNAATFGVDVEATLLKCFDLIDLDDSQHMARLNLKRTSSKHTMLHYACSLGLNRVVAALLARGANPASLDKGGYTPMHFAALHNHPQIVRRLMLNGADPTIRSLRGYTASDMATSEEVIQMTRYVEHHSRTRSGSSLKSRTSSATSLRSVWEPLPRSLSVAQDFAEDSDDGDNEYEDDDTDGAKDGAFWMRSTSVAKAQRLKSEVLKPQTTALPVPDQVGFASPAAAMSAFRDHITTQVLQFQQTMQHNLPNLPQMPALPDYQNYLGPNAPMVRRISNLVTSRHDGTNAVKEQDYKWWDLFSGNVPAAPPAYEDIFPQGDSDTKTEIVTRTASQASADAVADNKCAELFDHAESSTVSRKKPLIIETVRIGNQHTITREQQDQLRLAHAAKVKRLSRDRNLFFIWVSRIQLVLHISH